MSGTKRATRMACSALCRGAKGKRCLCSCGGANHAKEAPTERPSKHGQIALPLGCGQKTPNPEDPPETSTELTGDYYWDKW